MKHKFRALPQFRHYIGESHSPEERIAGATPNELRQMIVPQRMSVGRDNIFKIDEYGVIIGYRPKGVVYSC